MLRSRCVRHLSLLLTAVLLWTVVLAGLARLSGVSGAGDKYNIVLWIGVHLPRPWLNGPARQFGGGYPPASNDALVSFFGQTSALSAAETEAAYAEATGALEDAGDRRVFQQVQTLRGLQWPVQARISAELASVVRDERLDAPVPLTAGLRVVWPPLNFSFDLPPYLLIRSRRDRIGVVSTTLLRGDLPSAQRKRLEDDARRQGYSALIVRVGGIATYPSIVEADDNYGGTLDLVAHEWMHQYLFFHPLGIRYFVSSDLTTINETVANMAGQELARAVRARFPLSGMPKSSHANVPPEDKSVDFNRTLHELRLEVDSLLAQGKVSEAESRMNETQRFLVQHGYYVGTINQAYFAFYGTYADTAASSNPLGPQLAELRTRYSTLAGFIHAVQGVTSVPDLQQLLGAQR
ncbi:MAG: hypothetical protein ACR2PL_18585 [Dehalococcoidia bacterium]